MGLNGNRIRELRLAKGMTMEELGKACNVQKSAVNKWEKGIVTNISFENMNKLCHALDCTPAYLCGLDDLSADTIPTQMRLSRETGIPLHKLGVNPNDYNNLMRHNIIRNKVSEEIAGDFMNYIIGAAEDNQLSPSEISSLMDTHEKMVDAIEKENDKDIKYYASAGESKIHDIKSISTKIPNWDEAAPTNALDTDKLLELGNIIKKMDNDQLTKLIKHANLIEKGEL